MPNILVVDDNEPFREFLCVALQRAGYHVTEARDGQECIQIANTTDVDLIITDLFMPNIDGFELIAMRNACCPTVPIIGMTGGFHGNEREYKRQFERLSNSVALAKPFSVAELLAVVGSLVPLR